MFNNIGSKIKLLATVVCWIGIVASVISGIALMEDEGFLGFVLIIIGSLVSWVSSFCLYGFGELIEKTTEIAKNTRCCSVNDKTDSTKSIDANYEKKERLKRWKMQGLITEEEYLTRISEL